MVKNNQPLETTLVVSGQAEQKYTFTLQPAYVSVTIKANVAGAAIYVNNENKGSTPATIMLLPGQYQLRLAASGYQPLQTNLVVSNVEKQEYTFPLQPAQVSVTLNANVAGATVYVNNERKATTPAKIMLLPGTYQIRLVADKYEPLQANINVGAVDSETFAFQLTPSPAIVNFLVPEQFINQTIENPLRLIRLYADDVLLNPNGEFSGIRVPAGRHLMRLSSGGLTVFGIFDIQPAATYNIQLHMVLNLVE